MLEEHLCSVIEFDGKIGILKADYPACYIAYCFHYKQHEEAENYKKYCLDLKDGSPHTFSQYIHGGLIPMIEDERLLGLTKKGKCH